MSQHSDVNYDGTYSNSFQTSNGIAYSETGKGGHVSNGLSQYYDPQGQLHELSWVADENGYRASGADVPTPPPIPSYILRALEYIRTHPSKESQPEQWKQNNIQVPSKQLFFWVGDEHDHGYTKKTHGIGQPSSTLNRVLRGKCTLP